MTYVKEKCFAVGDFSVKKFLHMAFCVCALPGTKLLNGQEAAQK